MIQSRQQFSSRILNWLDIVAITAWGVLLLSYWLTGKLGLLIHPRYFGLSVIAGFGLLVVGALGGRQLMRSHPVSVRHFTLFPPGWMSSLLLATACLGLLVTPQPFASHTALQRGINEPLALTRSQPQTFRANAQPEARSLIDWVRTLDVYPEPDAYAGQKVKVQGFVVHSPEMPDQYLTISRFAITCCAADAYPVGLPVKLQQSRRAYPPDTWLEVEGKMVTENLQNKRQLTIQAKSLKPISEPKNPYAY
ncbi:Uncharacterized membrane protein [uncultured Synechococcales cyanobacterium]|uniref:Uncharacterized membrane protein n=1 Tax=uncultured Synechococcales cyanobacterium TaxID=1936017 RepID=A0A6J4VDX0_9CYAN|nr:Uncharacterized membrane protein [uncultured Synechococcales cyanobacterium]